MTKSIIFSSTEVEELKAYYQLELDRTMKRIDDLKNIIEKLGGQESRSNIPQIENVPAAATRGRKVGRPAKVAKKTKSIPWRKFIPKILRKYEALNTHQIADHAADRFNFQDRDKLLRTLNPTLTRMIKLEVLESKKNPGDRVPTYKLKSKAGKTKDTAEAVPE